MGSMLRLAAVPLALIALLLLPGVVSADTEVPPYDYTVTSGDYILVVLAPARTYGSYATPTPGVIRSKYAKSGLYRAGDPSTPLWTIDWYAYDVCLAPDGVHLVRWGPWPSKGQYGTTAVQFYATGHSLTSYSVRDLVTDPTDLPESVSHFFWRDRFSFNGTTGELALSTLTGEAHIFDITTGQRRPAGTPWPQHGSGCTSNGQAASAYIPARTPKPTSTPTATRSATSTHTASPAATPTIGPTSTSPQSTTPGAMVAAEIVGPAEGGTGSIHAFPVAVGTTMLASSLLGLTLLARRRAGKR